MSEYLILGSIVIAVLIFLVKKNLTGKRPNKPTKNMTIDDQYNSDRREREKEIDILLGKMGKNGLDDLSAKDRKRLDELSKKLR